MPCCRRYTMARPVHNEAQHSRTASSTGSSPNVGVGLLLTGEACVGQIFGGRRRSYGHRYIVTELGVASRDLGAKIGGNRPAGEQGADQLAEIGAFAAGKI